MNELYTKFVELIILGEIEQFEKLIRENLFYIQYTDDEGWLLLHHAVEQGQIEAVKILVELGSQVDARTYSSYTPFHLMITANAFNNEIAKILIEAGAEVGTLLSKAIFENDDHSFYKYVSSPFMLNTPDRYGNYPIHNAITLGKQLYFEQLIASGANLEVIDHYQTTPLHTAAADNRHWATTLLLKKGAAIEKRDYNGRTALHFAAGNGNFDDVKCLVEHKSKINVKDVFGNTPLHYAYENGLLDMAKWLISQGADDDICNLEGSKPAELYDEELHSN